LALGLAWLLFKSAWGLVTKAPDGWQGGLTLSGQTFVWLWILVAGAVASLLILLLWRREFAALGVVAFGLGVSSLHVGVPSLSLRFTWPSLFPLVPAWNQLWQGLVLLALPQVPLSLGNSVYATADAARQYFGQKASHVTERRLMLTMGASDAVTAVLGGVPVCHGCGAPLMLGVVFLGLGLVGAGASMQLFRLIPFPVLGVLLAYVGAQHMLLARDLRGVQAWVIALLVLVLAVWTGNFVIGFVNAALLYHAWNWIASRQAKPAGGNNAYVG
jgi:SulP family sulfate permease